MSRLIASPLLLAFASVAFAQSAAPEAPRGFAEAMQHAQAAAGAGDHAALRVALLAALGFAPDHAVSLVHLARAEAALGNRSAALDALQRLSKQGAVRDLGKDAALSAVADDPAFVAAVETMAANAAPLVASLTAHTLDEVDFVPEGLAHDAQSRRFFAGSLHRGGIVQWHAGESATPFHPFAPGTDTRVLGLRVDAPRSRLWAATLRVDSKAPPHARGRGGWAALEVFDLSSGDLLARYPAPDDGQPHLFNDIAIAADGAVYVTDSEAQAVYILRDAAKGMEKLVGSDGSFTYPNGITFDARGGLLVAHLEGLSRVVRGADTVGLQRVSAPEGVPTGGFDGLYACGPDVIGVQSRLGFQQITRLEFDAAGKRVTAAHVLERHHPEHDAATTGAIVGDDFHYIANAQLRRIDHDWNIAADPGAKPPLVLALPLAGACRMPDSPQ